VVFLPDRLCRRKASAIALIGVICLLLAQGSSSPVQGKNSVSTQAVADWKQNREYIQIVVKKGDTLWNIARDYGTTVQAIADYNRIANPNLIYTGQVLWVPTGKPAAAKPQTLAESRSDKTAKTTVVSRGTPVTEEELHLLARVIYAEARGEEFEGQVAVGAVVLNRVKDPRFPNTIKDVIYQPGAFTAVADRQIELQPNEKAYQAAKMALAGVDPTGGALYYYNPKIATDRWIKTRQVIKVIGNHNFSI